jgi:hypothetical protein
MQKAISYQFITWSYNMSSKVFLMCFLLAAAGVFAEEGSLVRVGKDGLEYGTIIFDSPVARDALPPWGTAPFYKDDAAWQEDLPLRTCEQFKAVMPANHKLVLISGTGFHAEMCTLSDKLSGIGLEHIFLPRPDMKHHWNSGWLEEGLNEVTGK